MTTLPSPARTGRLRAFAVALLAVATATTCSVHETLDSLDCDPGSSEVLISAQSVPTASLVACFAPLPAGWEVDEVHVGSDGTTVVFESDRAGLRAATFLYEAECDVGEATSTPSEFPPTQRYERVFEIDPAFRANRYYVFDGGCVTWEFDFDEGTPTAMAVELGNTLQLIDRDDLNADFRRAFIDEDL